MFERVVLFLLLSSFALSNASSPKDKKGPALSAPMTPKQIMIELSDIITEMFNLTKDDFKYLERAYERKDFPFNNTDRLFEWLVHDKKLKKEKPALEKKLLAMRKLHEELKAFKAKTAHQVLDRLWTVTRNARYGGISNNLENNVLLYLACTAKESTRKYLFSKIPSLKPHW
ncbi:hypothetical protein COOONC_22245 [Cooperia oncophora]